MAAGTLPIASTSGGAPGSNGAGKDAAQEGGASRSRSRRGDPRSKHPAIEAARFALGGTKYPPLGLYDTIIEVVGDRPDAGRMAACRGEWLERGYIPTSWKWLTEWYAQGWIPEQGGRGHSGREHSARASPGDDGEAEALTAVALGQGDGLGENGVER